MTDEDNLTREQRRELIDDARYSTYLEGGRSSDEARALQDLWVDGAITRAELRTAIARLQPSRNDTT